MRHLMKDYVQIITKKMFLMVFVNRHKNKHIATEIQTRKKKIYHLGFTLNNTTIAFQLQVSYYIAYGLLL